MKETKMCDDDYNWFSREYIREEVAERYKKNSFEGMVATFVVLGTIFVVTSICLIYCAITEFVL